MGTNQHLPSLKFGVHLGVVRVNCRCAVTIDSMQVLLLSQRRKGSVLKKPAATFSNESLLIDFNGH